MAIIFKDAQQKLANASRISNELTDATPVNVSYVRNTHICDNKAKQSQVLEQLSTLNIKINNIALGAKGFILKFLANLASKNCHCKKRKDFKTMNYQTMIREC